MDKIKVGYCLRKEVQGCVDGKEDEREKWCRWGSYIVHPRRVQASMGPEIGTAK
jgi:hypothetical protein